jgi:DNA-binding transcriptional ArsR family regulator
MGGLKIVCHIVPVGFAAGKLIEGVKQFSVHKVVVVASGEDERVKKAVKEVEKAFKSYAEVEKRSVDFEDVFQAALDFIEIIRVEREAGRKVMINAAGSLRNVTLASYIAAQATKTKIYSSHSRYDEKGVPVGINKIINIPYFPIHKPPKEQIEVLEALGKGEVESIDELIARMRPEIEKGTKEHGNERARLSKHISKLRDERFVETDKMGKTVSLKLSKMGEVYVAGHCSILNCMS